MVITSEAILKGTLVYQFLDGRFLLISENNVNSAQNKELIKFFFKPFNIAERFCTSPDSVAFQDSVNQVFSLGNLDLVPVKSILDLINESDCKVTEKSYLVVLYFEDCVIDDEVTDVYGMVMFENKEHFLSIKNQSDPVQLLSGSSNGKIEKGALIFNSQADEGLQCLVLDKKNTGWKEALGIRKIKDNYFQTQTLINNVQEFAHTSFEQEESPEKIALLNESIQYIKSHDFFDQSDYQEKVLQEPELIEKFETFNEEKKQEIPEMETSNFEISKPAISKTKRFIRSVIKLDKNFHVYVHGNRENITRGFDEEKGKHFYTLFYDEEN